MTRDEFKVAWLAALRSGDYTKVEQVYSAGNKCFCTLGLGESVITGDPESFGAEHVFRVIPELAPSRDDVSLWSQLTARNDGIEGYHQHTFDEMADWLETTI